MLQASVNDDDASHFSSLKTPKTVAAIRGLISILIRSYVLL